MLNICKTFFNLTAFICGLILVFISHSAAQTTAILTPIKSTQTQMFAEKFESSLSKHVTVTDLSLAESVFEAKGFETPFNLSTEQSKILGQAIGCNFLLIIKTDTLRRSTFERAKYYESYATLYLVSTRTGRLVLWENVKFEKDTPNDAKSMLFSSINRLTLEITEKVKGVSKQELDEVTEDVTEIPLKDSPDAKGLRPPLPYKRIKPKYTSLAAIYDITATVDALVDVAADGKIQRIEIIRWAGYGLEESVIETVNKMNWRPADRNGKKMPMRILLRYNFRNIETN